MKVAYKTGKTNKTVAIKVEKTGTNFGVVGYVYSRGKIIHSTDVFPRTGSESALSAAKFWCDGR